MSDKTDNKILVPVCAWCKKVHFEGLGWTVVDECLTGRSDIEYSHAICPNCYKEKYPDDDID